MKILVQYQIEVAICMVTFALLYLLLWRKETNFAFKRFVLVLIPLFSIIIPLINFNIDLKPVQESAAIDYIIYLPSQLEMVYTPSLAEHESMSGWEIAFWVFVAGFFVMSIRLIVSYIRIIQIYRQSRPDESGEFRTIADPIHSFSFFKMLVLNRSQADSNEKGYILAHEKAHKNQGHSWDILWLEIVKMLHWFNPVIWLLTRESKKNLEYLADQEVAVHTDSTEKYQYAIVQHASHSGYRLLKTQFSKTNLKKRIIMMNQPNNRKIASWKLLTILPVLGILLMSFSVKIDNIDLKEELSDVLPALNSDESISRVSDYNSTLDQNNVDFPEISTASIVDGNPIEDTDKIYEASEVLPTPEGKRMKYFFSELFEYVENATGKKRNDINGSVIVHFIVMKDGLLRDIKILEGINSKIDSEVLHFVKEGPAWKPGLDVGVPVNVRMVIPINFGNNKELNKNSRGFVGKLINEQDFTAISGAKVTIKGTHIETHTDQAGIFKLNVQPGHEELMISSNDFSTRTIKISPNQNIIKYLIRVDGPKKSISLSDSVYHIVENPPQPLDGWANYYKVIDHNLQYPQKAKDKCISGKVFIELIVLKDGSPSNVRVIKGIEPDCDAEAARLVREGPRWKPGMEDGEFVNVRIAFPITFNPEYNPQKPVVHGVVKNENGNPIPGCNIVLEGTTTGTVTNVEGKFQLEIPPSTIAQKIIIASKGYTKETRFAHNGSYHAVVLKKASDQPVSLKILGVDVIQEDNQPLYILDGKEMSKEEMANISPSDIESLALLKDSSASSLYGEKGKYGVVIINSKDNARPAENELAVRGLVTDENGNPVPLANVIIKGTTSGTITDKHGRYHINVNKEYNALIFSSRDLKQKEVKIDGRSEIDVILKSK